MVRLQPVVQFLEIVLGQFLAAQAGPGVEELELDELIDRGFIGREGLHRASRQHGDAGRRIQGAQAADGGDAGDEVPDMVQLHDQDVPDRLGPKTGWPDG